MIDYWPVALAVFVGAFFAVLPRVRHAIQDAKYEREQSARSIQRRADVSAIRKGICPDCGSNGTLVSGPQDGRHLSALCDNCLSEFKVSTCSAAGIFDATREGKANAERAEAFGIDRERYQRITAKMAGVL